MLGWSLRHPRVVQFVGGAALCTVLMWALEDDELGAAVTVVVVGLAVHVVKPGGVVGRLWWGATGRGPDAEPGAAADGGA